MANYNIDADILMPFLPQGVELDLYDGKAYVSLVGFIFKRCRIFNIPIPLMGTFEEINLRFYVRRKVGDTYRRGVVFINETIPYPIVAWVANILYKEHYTVVPTKHEEEVNSDFQKIKFEWLVNSKWNSMEVSYSFGTDKMKNNSLEQFIYDHYYGYTKVNETKTEEYKLQHPSWKTHTISNYEIDCDFQAMYGTDFAILNETKPAAVFIAKGSKVGIEWKRNKLQL
jgi:uncharacterized protein YqjF (DUF2071 family)